MAPSQSKLKKSESIGAAMSAATSLIAILVFIGWIFDIAFLKSLLPGFISMKFNTALALFLFSACQFCLLLEKSRGVRLRPLAKTFVILGTLIGVATAQVGVQDLSRARKFYDQVLRLLDMNPIFHRPTNIVYGKTNPEFIISSEKVANEFKQSGDTFCVGLWANSIETVDAVYKEALACGGTSLQVPGFKDRHLYTSSIKDLDGNSLEIMKWFDDPAKPTG